MSTPKNLDGSTSASASAADGRTPLHVAARDGDDAAVQQLLDRGAAIDAVDARGYTALTLAVAGHHAGVVRALLARGASASPAQESPLIAAARAGDVDVVELLLDHGAPIEPRDHLGRGPLYWAAYLGHRAVVELLLDRGADVHARDQRGDTPLHGAASNVIDPEVLRVLIERGARIDVVDDIGATPIDLAEREGERELMQSMRDWAAP